MNNFNVEKVIADYRKAVAKRDSDTDKKKRSAAQATALGLRAEWKEWNGDDELYEMAFGKPFDTDGNPL